MDTAVAVESAGCALDSPQAPLPPIIAPDIAASDMDAGLDELLLPVYAMSHMMRNNAISDNILIRETLALLTERLPSGWRLSPKTAPAQSPFKARRPGRAEGP